MSKPWYNFRIREHMRKYKILYLNHVSYIGGAEIALLDLLTYVDRDAYTHVVLAPDGDLIRARKMTIQKSQAKDAPPELIDLGRVGEVTQVNPDILQTIEVQDFIPVIAPVVDMVVLPWD